MYKIKQIPEDFIVKEVSNLTFKKQGKFFCYWLTKKDYTTMAAIQIVAKENNLPLSVFSFAGNKDRRAITKQLISVKKKLKKLELKDISLEFAGNLDKPVSLGYLKGNDFSITIRNLSKKPNFHEEFINYFGEQRFSENNVEVGRAIIKGDFKKAAELLKLDIKNNNFLAELRRIPKKTLVFYIHAFQSFIWNQAVELFLKDNPKYDEKVKLSIVGFASKDLDKYTKSILEKEDLSPRNFIIRSLPDLSSEGDVRNIWVKAENLKISKLEDDELNKDMKKIKIDFFLPKGCYATEFIRQNL